MLRFVYISLLALGSVWSRDPLRARTMPTITNSLVNLGKMDIAFYIDNLPKDNIMQFNSKPVSIIDECLCNSMRNSAPLGGGSSFINKILSSNDFFNLDKEVTYGPQCCESHEESTITFEFGPKEFGPKTIGNAAKPILQPISPLILDSILPPKKFNSPFTQTALKPKAIEIFLFPKKEGLDNKSNKLWFNNFGPKKSLKKDIKLVGDKDLKSSFDAKTSNDVKDAYDDKYSNVNDGKVLKSVKSNSDLTKYDNNKYDNNKYDNNKYDNNKYDNNKYETAQPVTMKKEIGIKDQEAESKSDEKEESQKDMTNISKPQ
ncbi:uncharacterized protein LOC128673551 isoform X2 [Plodia interpunctella]|uniref:uncharacterized protein LOC128673551 isoform X2 n=1 Tax=Plodia interpunctella TaxID=58824 RepID=UPI0023687A1B|nr:uncharacterized protein LOC128673551 isoform X2 [Plodia interpunctella]